MKKLLFIITVVTGIAILASSTCSAEEDFWEGKKQGDFAFLGIEAGELRGEIFKEIGRDYRQEFSFLNQMGKYLSDIPLKIYDRKDKPFLTMGSDKPSLFFDIPLGTYRLQAVFQLDQKKISPIDIEKKKENVFSGQLSIRW